MCRVIYSSLYRPWVIQWWGDWLTDWLSVEAERDFSYCVCNVSCHMLFSLKGMGDTMVTDWLRGRKRLQLLCVKCVVAYILLFTCNDGTAKNIFKQLKKNWNIPMTVDASLKSMYVRFFLREVAKISSRRNESAFIEFMVIWVTKIFSIK